MITPEFGHSSPQFVVDDNTTSRPQPKTLLPEKKNLTSAVTLSGAPGTTNPLGTEDMSSTTTRGWRFYGAFGTLCLVTFIIALDSTIICVALPTIAEDIGVSAIGAFWCGTSFLLASTAVQPLLHLYPISLVEDPLSSPR
ncbi:hypothetical protein NXS19_012082 [Fusarium pseudograminearum]|nr:hypothetical protein NXS19_012082 [Fusarium pseudograminearum]